MVRHLLSQGILIAALLLILPGNASAVENNPLDKHAEKLANQCVKEIVVQFDLLLTGGQLTMAQLFDTF